MSPRLRYALPVSLLAASALFLSGCSALETVGLAPESEPVVSEEGVSPETEAGETPAEGEETPAAPTTADIAVPTCDTLYSAETVTALLNEVRVNQGDTSDGDYGFGTINRDLVSVLKSVRPDLRVSCTWYLPASESVSVTSVAIIGAEQIANVNRTLGASGATQSEAGGGILWKIDSATTENSPDYIATESHFVVGVPCPSSLAETQCAAWVSTNYSFGQAEALTIDAATTLGVYNR
jgi:hypothetical protein